MPDAKEPRDVVLRRIIEGARLRYAEESGEDWRGFDLDLAEAVIDSMAFKHQSRTIAWLHAKAHNIPYTNQTRSGDDDIPTRSAWMASYYALRNALLGRH
jgi:hypothetical protein